MYSAVYAVARCLSVRPSVTFVYSVEISKHILELFRDTVAHHSSFFHTKYFDKLPTGSSLTERRMQVRYEKLAIFFRQISRFIIIIIIIMKSDT